MSTHGRSLDVRVPPIPQHRASRYVAGADALVLGAPVVTNGLVDGYGRQKLVYASADAAAPKPSQGGVLLWEAGPDAFRGFYRELTTFSDIGTVPLGKGVQLINGDEVVLCFKNLASELFLNSHTYAARKMVAGAGATPSLVVGDGLTPGLCTDSGGYWKKNAGSAANTWLIVREIDTARDEVTARLAF